MSIDALLYRQIRQNSPFEGLIPAYQKQEISFDKESDNSTTYDTLNYMNQWATKYAHQMKLVAPRLKGSTLRETVNNIYQFLYSHFQYKLDGSLQNLYSPSAAWHFRKEGFDCKTYSILASTILRNLSIPHTFRMVQQAGIMPGQWSHVYVIVPDNNTHLVIDATTHTNREVSFTKKHDYTMIHRGLASPYPYSALGCACQGRTIKKNVGLGAPAMMEQTIANFHLFLNELEKKGFPREVTDKMLYLVKSNIENGIDPNFDEIVHKAIIPQSQLGEILPVSSLISSGGTFNLTPTASPVTIQGAPVSGIMSSITGLITGNPLAAIGLITSLIPLDKTFGAVFANGFNLSCWGSTVTPSMAKGWGEKDFPMVLNETLGKGITQANFHLYLDAMNHLETQARNWGAKMRSCSQKGLYQYANAAKTAKEGMILGVKQALAQNNIQINQIQSVTLNSKLPFTFQSSVFTHEYVPYVSERFNIIVPPPPPPQQQQQQSSNEVATNQDGTPVKSSSATVPLVIGGLVLAAKFLL